MLLYDQAAWNYRSTVVTAFQNVADALRAIQNDADALKAATDFERASKTSLDLAQQQMASGNANFLYLLQCPDQLPERDHRTGRRHRPTA